MWIKLPKEHGEKRWINLDQVVIATLFPDKCVLLLPTGTHEHVNDRKAVKAIRRYLKRDD